MKLNKLLTLAIALACGCGMLSAQNKKTADTTVIVKEGDRNVMLNAASANAGPRDVNIGLPASVGGMTVLENDLPVVYFFWPEMPSRTWRSDAMTTGIKLLDLGATAIHSGDVGYSINSHYNLGTDRFQVVGSLKSNHFGLLNGDFALSNRLGNGWKYAAGVFANYAPGTFRSSVSDRFYADQMLLLKGALTKEYRIGDAGKGSVSLLYKHADMKSFVSTPYAPYLYSENGKVKELDHFRIGNDSYIQGQKLMLKDAQTGQYVERDGLNDYGTTSHTVDLIGKNRFDNGLNFNYIVRAHSAFTGTILALMTGVQPASSGNYAYFDSGDSYAGQNVQGVMVLASRRTPIRSLTSLFELGKQSGNHAWKVGLNQWNYSIDRFLTEGTRYYQEIAANPRKLIDLDKPGNSYGNTGDIYEYHNGTENKTAIFVSDQWDVSDVVTLNGGIRLEYQNLRGDYIDNTTPREAIYIHTPKTKIKDDFFNKAMVLGGIFKLTSGFGLLAEATYNEQSGHLENYSAGNNPHLRKSTIPGGTLGAYFNHPLVSLVSKATYIQRDEYRGTVNFTHPQDLSLVTRAATSYDIQTLGWTTDVVASPFKNFNLHLLFTYQNPVYKNYAGTADFGDGKTIDYDFSGKVVNKISKVLIEIDPSYTWRNLRMWLSARYFSKQYANLPNTLYFAGRWETFAGVNLRYNANLDLYATAVNLLNDRGAQGSISGTDLVDEATARQKIGTVMSGTYIRPFTVEFGMKYRFF